MYNYIKKRDGRKVKFNDRKIMSAIERAGLETGEFAEAEADKLAKKVLARAEKELTEKVSSKFKILSKKFCSAAATKKPPKHILFIAISIRNCAKLPMRRTLT